MYIREIVVSNCTETDITAKDIVNSKGVIIVAKGTIITDYIKKRLIEIGIKSVYIYNSGDDVDNTVRDLSYEDFKRNYRQTILLTKNIINDLTSGQTFQYDKVTNATDIILNSINDKDNIINCLCEIRSADEYTYTHSVNVAFYSMLIGTWLKLSDKEIRDVIQAGLLHDIGKIKISNELLNKKGILTSEEFDVIRSHTILGYELLNKVEDINLEVKRAVLLHHERTDGSGYPFNTQAHSVGLYAKIVAIADVFDAMTSDRIYKKKKTPFDAFEMFKTVGIGIFDINILNIFLKNLSTYYTGSSVTLNNGERGKIVYISPQNILNPIIELQSKYFDLSIQSDFKIISMD